MCNAFFGPGYWMDIGQPKDFLEGQRYYLNTAAASSPSE